MVIDLFSKALETPAIPAGTLVKVNKLMVENIEKMMLFQMNSLKTYLDIGINQMRAAAEINDVKVCRVSTSARPTLRRRSSRRCCMMPRRCPTWPRASRPKWMV